MLFIAKVRGLYRRRRWPALSSGVLLAATRAANRFSFAAAAVQRSHKDISKR
jgi:hypothetical protein